jgi:molybdopterin-guanine dinucleotide biosynthesis protein A
VKPEEKRLEELSAIWEKEQEKEKRKKSLPQRKNDLRFIYEAYNVDYVEVEDDYLLSLNDFEFDQFKNDRKLIILNEKEKAQEEIRLKTERELNERIQKRKDLLREV